MFWKLALSFDLLKSVRNFNARSTFLRECGPELRNKHLFNSPSLIWSKRASRWLLFIHFILIFYLNLYKYFGAQWVEGNATYSKNVCIISLWILTTAFYFDGVIFLLPSKIVGSKDATNHLDNWWPHCSQFLDTRSCHGNCNTCFLSFSGYTKESRSLVFSILEHGGQTCQNVVHSNVAKRFVFLRAFRLPLNICFRTKHTGPSWRVTN